MGTSTALAQSQRYRIVEVGALQHYFPNPVSSQAFGINAHHQVVGRTLTPAIEYRAFVWLPEPAYGLPAGLNLLPGPSGGAEAHGINDGGFAAGLHLNVVSEASVWNLNTWQHTGLNGLLNSTNSWATAINNSNVVVGTLCLTPTNCSGSLRDFHGFRVEFPISGHTLPRPPVFPFEYFSTAAEGIGDTGIAVGEVRSTLCDPHCDPQDCQRGLAWPFIGGVHILASLSDDDGQDPPFDVGHSIGYDANAYENIVGVSYQSLPGGCTLRAAAWPNHLSQPKPLRFLPGLTFDYTQARAISDVLTNPLFPDEIHIVGWSDGLDRAMLWRKVPGVDWDDAVAVNLDAVACGDWRWIRVLKAHDVNNSGWVAGEGLMEVEGYTPRTVALVLFPLDPNCPADLNGDGVVDVLDMIELLDAWGPNPRSCADLNGDGVVDVLDLNILLDQWGPCPGSDAPGMSLQEALNQLGITEEQWNTYTGGEPEQQ
jgi:hypothetical protein